LTPYLSTNFQTWPGIIFFIRPGRCIRKCNIVSTAFISTRARANSNPRGPTRGINHPISPRINPGIRRTGKPPAASSVFFKNPFTAP
jgi:hypothetical protein